MCDTCGCNITDGNRHLVSPGGRLAQTEDGRALGNGVYLVRIVVDDGSRQEPRVLKVAIWNER